MQDITVEIKAEDILENNYTDAQNCAMTKALRRAGFEHLEDCIGLYNNQLHIETDLRYDTIMDRVRSMYASINPNGWGKDTIPIKATDFQATFSADI